MIVGRAGDWVLRWGWRKKYKERKEERSSCSSEVVRRGEFEKSAHVANENLR